MIPRLLHKWYANLMGYFWLSCPICGEMFGGHELHGWGIYIIDGQGWCYCKKDSCHRVALKQMHERGWSLLPHFRG